MEDMDPKDEMARVVKIIYNFENNIGVLREVLNFRPDVLASLDNGNFDLNTWAMEMDCTRGKNEELRFQVKYTTVPRINKEYEPLYFILVRIAFIATEALNVRVAQKEWDDKCTEITEVLCRLVFMFTKIEDSKSKTTEAIYKDCYRMYNHLPKFFRSMLIPMDNDEKSTKDFLCTLHKNIMLYHHRAHFLISHKNKLM